MASTFRPEVLKIFKQLHKTRKIVFKEDSSALDAARKKINEEFKKNKSISDVDQIEEKIKLSYEVENILRTKVVQATEKKPGTYELRLRPEVQRLDNAKFIPTAPDNDNVKNEGTNQEKIKSGQTITCCKEQQAQTTKIL
ncbi:complex III assembly factor LYRM7 [Lycorma delicatula]|uniref:complex III assembly factor LYRM7 n=1 Tax=Lycorma delicatula TaxID=130591 RepID=UPI003F50F01B